jgi:UDP-hydrolysing UDP-N-acetyl-D-glucosamine 2-epimerase
VTAARRICVVTGTRAEYGLLYWVLEEIARAPALDLGILVTGAHLSPEFGLTYRDIEADGFRIDAKVEMLLSSDSAVGIAKSLALGVAGCAEAFDRMRPDLLLMCGDRYEVLAAAQAALIAKIPVAHIAGGDTTEGAYDEAIRHAVTKMSHLHFVTNAEAARRVRQLGEDPAHIYQVGSPGVDYIKRKPLLDRKQLEAAIGFSFRPRNLLVTFHPSTLDHASVTDQFRELLDGLDRLGPDVGVLLTKPNADVAGRSLFPLIDQYQASHPNVRAFVSMGHLNYLSAMAQVDAVVGNSSSGLYEAPSFKKPTVNVGDRQKGRLRAVSVIDCEVNADAIAAAIRTAFGKDCSEVRNPYGEGDASGKIVKVLSELSDGALRGLIKKPFWDLA